MNGQDKVMRRREPEAPAVVDMTCILIASTWRPMETALMPPLFSQREVNRGMIDIRVHIVDRGMNQKS